MRLIRFRTIVRSLSRKSSSSSKDSMILADALNLLSRDKNDEGSKLKQATNSTTAFQPSLFQNLTQGSAVERFQVEHEPSPIKSPNQKTREKYVTNLLLGIKLHRVADNSTLLSLLPKKVGRYIGTVENERRLIEILQFFYFHDQLNLKLLMELVLNRNFCSLQEGKIPVKLTLLRDSHDRLQWKEIDYVQFDIVLLKKYYDWGKPLMIIKNLKANFNKYYAPALETHSLLPFYERILWKFYFEYIKQFDEIYYIRQLDNIKSTFLILESSQEKSKVICEEALIQHKDELNILQQIFLAIVSNTAVQSRINTELNLNGTQLKLLSLLKKVSIKYKLSSLDVNNMEEDNKLTMYMVINALENILWSSQYDLASNDGHNELFGYLNDLRCFREEKLMKIKGMEKEPIWNEVIRLY
ncbi:uncharacterized protein KQ657_000638 [Scheffersomyces spartinae]|uniref:Uncharacterized protein n=1 Tax=Scheffersomyces spartinae TaxID=45513 RepID=A0A9P7V998_9ASCO|nr:uncharacterized protein KQ657_000638 [Scheffersomyces spartinae]KAG7193569.1 hypothetical protein KQ657_000638 [Scheffersomyces spartinae]